MTNPKLAVMAAAALALAAPAHAIDNMTGTYNGKVSCKAYTGGGATKSKDDVTISVVEDDATRLRVAIDSVLVGSPIPVLRIADMDKPDRAKIQGLDCPSTAFSPYSLSIVGDVVIKPDSEKGTIKGTLINRNALDPAEIEVCAFTVKRTSIELPEVLPCAPE